MSSEHYKSGFVALLGRPNVGKSSIINALLGEKVAAVSPKPQTTRNAVRCIYTTDNEQIIFVDTPGIHTPKHALGDFMMKEAEEALMQVDAICYVVEAQDRAVSEKDRVILAALAGVRLPIVLAVNKTDKLGNAADYMKSEVPHGVAVVIDEFKSPDEYPELKVCTIRATIVVDRPGQKGIIIGKNGAMLKQIGSEARAELEEKFGYKVFLQLWVKVRPGWRKSPEELRRLGYGA